MEKKLLNINGISRTRVVDPDANLADVLRGQLGLTGTKIGCGTAQCGACSVIMDGKVVRSCVTKMKKVAMCRDYFASRGKRTLHLLDLIFPPSHEEAAGFRGPGFSQRHENRIHLKESLLKTLWRERERECVSAREGYERLKLIIPADVREVMESRLILEDDVRKVIDFAERTGKRLLDSGNTHFIAYCKPNNVTYWVEYSPRGDTFLIHNTYSHGMEIVEETGR
jgi:glutamate synthase (NADPH) small chain